MNKELQDNDTNVSIISEHLKNKKIACVVGTGIASMELPKIARELRRHGASVQFFVSERVFHFIGQFSLEWSSENLVISEPSSFSEHIASGFDLVIVCPATLNMMTKFNLGICDTNSLTLLQSALGAKIPIFICPTMHETLSHSPNYKKHLRGLKEHSCVHIINPLFEENKLKVLPAKTFVREIIHAYNKIALPGHFLKSKVFLAFGSSSVSIDPVRCLSNKSTGRSGLFLLKELYLKGFNLKALMGRVSFDIPYYQDLELVHREEYDDQLSYIETMDFSDCFAFLNLLAGSDFNVKEKSLTKIPSNKGECRLTLKPLKKIFDCSQLNIIPYKHGSKLVSSKLSLGLQSAKDLMTTYKLDSVFLNSSDDVFEKNVRKGILIKKQKEKLVSLEIQDLTQLSLSLVLNILNKVELLNEKN